jgi:hypothetical protein
MPIMTGSWRSVMSAGLSQLWVRKIKLIVGEKSNVKSKKLKIITSFQRSVLEPENVKCEN